MKWRKSVWRIVLGILFIAAGANHFWHNAFYVRMIPPLIPWHEALVAVSGIAEILLGALLLIARSSVGTAWGLIALLIAVFPANIHMALHPESFSWASPVALWLRLPFQPLLIAWAYWYTRPEHRDK